MKGIGPKSLSNLRMLAAAGGWLESGEYFRRVGPKGNRLPFLMFKARVVESFTFCPLEGNEEKATRIGYRLTDAGRDLLSTEER